MKKIEYHKNARTDAQTRKLIKESNLTIKELSLKLNLNKNTILKWKHRDDIYDKSCKPLNIKKKLTAEDEKKILAYKKKYKLGIDLLTKLLIVEIPYINRWLIYRCLKKYG